MQEPIFANRHTASTTDKMDSSFDQQLSPEEISALLLEKKRLQLANKQLSLEVNRLREAETARVARGAEEAAAARARRDQQKEDQQRALDIQTQADGYKINQDRLKKSGVTTPSKVRDRKDWKVQPVTRPRSLAPHSGRVIRCSDDLSAAEKHHLLDDMIVAMENRDNHASIDPAATAQVTDERREQALVYLFEGSWNTRQPHIDSPDEKLLKKTAEETSVAFGVFNKDHPDIKAKVDEGLATEHDYRAPGKTCYIHINQRREQGEITFDIKDGKGAFISWDHVLMDEGWTIYEAKRQVIDKFDRENDRKVHTYNCRLFKFKGQRRLIEYAGKGDANRVKPEFNKSLDAKDPEFGKTFPTLPILDRQVRDLGELRDGMVQDGPRPKIHRFI
ncbi:hypothetical protein CC79DRAFT_1361993 [Sarocladium strictum]